jgi:hypothetical protein
MINWFFEYLFRLLASILTIFRNFLKFLTGFCRYFWNPTSYFPKSTGSQYTNRRSAGSPRTLSQTIQHGEQTVLSRLCQFVEAHYPNEAIVAINPLMPPKPFCGL